MSNIKSKETRPEILVRKFLFSKGLRYRKNIHTLPGKPDIVLAKYKTVIFINGCFWHGHSCKAAKLPSTHTVFWKTKITGNIIRDKKNISILKRNGWNVYVIWQCQLKNKKLFADKLNKLIKRIKNKL